MSLHPAICAESTRRTAFVIQRRLPELMLTVCCCLHEVALLVTRVCSTHRNLPDPAGEFCTCCFHFITLFRTAAPTSPTHRSFLLLSLAFAIFMLTSRVQWLLHSLVHLAKSIGKQGRSGALARKRMLHVMHIAMSLWKLRVLFRSRCCSCSLSCTLCNV